MLNELLYSADNVLADVEAFAEVNERFSYLPVDDQNVEYRDYLVERLPNNLFVYQFFPDTSEIDARRTDSTTAFIDLTTEVRINETANTLTVCRRAALGYGTNDIQ
ncbi:MAG: hypothetical protein U5K84_13355 [Alkalibacterium sp.]|nr:hypothetical protein [Alkalibacterium sp.]